MPTNRRFRKTQVREKLTECQWAYLIDDREKARELDLWETFFVLESPHDNHAELRGLWAEYRDAVLDVWTREFPGTRPSTWWRFDAPRIPPGKWPRFWFDGKLPQPREQLRGSGSPSWDDGFNIVPAFECGIPASWVNIKADDPPVFESQASYLKRIGLLTAAEKRKLPAGAFEPELMTGLCNDELPQFILDEKGVAKKCN